MFAAAPCAVHTTGTTLTSAWFCMSATRSTQFCARPATVNASCIRALSEGVAVLPQ